MNIILINDKNINLLKKFIGLNDSKNFRYFNSRNVNVIKNHIVTLLVIDDNDINAVIEVLKSEYLTQGPCVDLFEKSISSKVNSKFAIAVSGTISLELALNKVPLIVVYQLNYFTYLIGHIFVKSCFEWIALFATLPCLAFRYNQRFLNCTKLIDAIERTIDKIS